MANFGIVAVHPSASRAHTFAHASTPSGNIFEVWTGPGSTANPFYIHSNGDVLATPISSPSIATSATAGFFFIRSCAGAPSGVPANAASGRVACVYDRSNNKLYVYNAGWVGVTLS